MNSAAVESVFSPVATPNANAHCERFIKSLQDECLDRLWFVGERSLRLVLNEYVDHFHRERHHQGIGHVIIDPGPEVNLSDGGLRRRKRLGGLLNYYYREWLCRKSRRGLALPNVTGVDRSGQLRTHLLHLLHDLQGASTGKLFPKG